MTVTRTVFQTVAGRWRGSVWHSEWLLEGPWDTCKCTLLSAGRRRPWKWETASHFLTLEPVLPGKFQPPPPPYVSLQDTNVSLQDMPRKYFLLSSLAALCFCSAGSSRKASSPSQRCSCSPQWAPVGSSSGEHWPSQLHDTMWAACESSA